MFRVTLLAVLLATPLPVISARRNVIDLLKILGLNRGVRSQTDPLRTAYKMRRSSPHLTMSPRITARLAKPHRALGLLFEARQSRHSSGPLLSIVSPQLAARDGRPFFELWSDARTKVFGLEYRQHGSFSPASITFPDPTPFRRASHLPWARVALHFSSRYLRLMVDCDPPLELVGADSRPFLALSFPSDLRIAFSSSALPSSGGQFTGYWRKAKIYLRGLPQHPWTCLKHGELENTTQASPIRVPNGSGDVKTKGKVSQKLSASPQAFETPQNAVSVEQQHFSLQSQRHERVHKGFSLKKSRKASKIRKLQKLPRNRNKLKFAKDVSPSVSNTGLVFSGVTTPPMVRPLIPLAISKEPAMKSMNIEVSKNMLEDQVETTTAKLRRRLDDALNGKEWPTKSAWQENSGAKIISSGNQTQRPENIPTYLPLATGSEENVNVVGSPQILITSENTSFSNSTGASSTLANQEQVEGEVKGHSSTQNLPINPSDRPTFTTSYNTERPINQQVHNTHGYQRTHLNPNSPAPISIFETTTGPTVSQSTLNSSRKIEDIDVPTSSPQAQMSSHHELTVPVDSGGSDKNSSIMMKDHIFHQRKGSHFPTNRPNTVKSLISDSSLTQPEERLEKVEESVRDLSAIVTLLQSQNSALLRRMQLLEDSECRKPHRKWNIGPSRTRQYPSPFIGSTRSSIHPRSNSELLNPPEKPPLSYPITPNDSLPTFSTHGSHTDPLPRPITSPPVDPCAAKTRCLHGGTCVPSGMRHVCTCTPSYTGSSCETPILQACYMPPDPGTTCHDRSTEPSRHWYFDPYSGHCKSFLYAGCTGNVNRFFSAAACRENCELGACCLRFSKGVVPQIKVQLDETLEHGGHDSFTGRARTELASSPRQSNRTFANHKMNFNGILRMNAEVSKSQNQNGSRCTPHSSRFQYHCVYTDRASCRVLHGDIGDLVSFMAGRRCSPDTCGPACHCTLGSVVLQSGETTKRGCELCQCDGPDTAATCTCHHMVRRKEIRDLTKAETLLYQHAIQVLHNQGVWTALAQRLAELEPQASDVISFLPRNRAFLQHAERELRSISCNIAVPYFEWTIDAGSVQTSSVWQDDIFGGDGEQEPTACVGGTFFEVPGATWSPCLRRRFNTSVSLPDAAHLGLALTEQSFESFSSRLALASLLFRFWVGGHMATPLAAYDPIFLSHIAFLDRLWTLWQKGNHRESTEIVQGSPSSRSFANIVLLPLANSIGQVWTQPCLTYAPPTLGAPCNLSNVQSTMASDFEAYGHDSKSLTMSRSQVDSHDQLGFNRDGFDSFGYDISGYNRHGYNRSGVSSFGMVLDGTFPAGVHGIDVLRRLFPGGYNRFGFDPWGFDHSGVDAFGFNRNGFDKDSCNRFFAGPHYLRFYFYIQQQLLPARRNEISQIRRVCLPVSPLPSWFLEQNWVHGEDEAQSWTKTRVRAIEAEWNSLRPNDPTFLPRNSSVTDDGLWIPITPDHRFCFQLHWFSGCPIFSPPVHCPDSLCDGKWCAGHPDALCRIRACGSCTIEWFNPLTDALVMCSGCVDGMGQLAREEGAVWEQDCSICTCQAGISSCTLRPCPPTQSLCHHPAAMDTDDCCLTCADCKYEGHVYENGETFNQDPCTHCVCLDGNVSCEIEHCAPSSCPNPELPPGLCCHICPKDCVEGRAHTEEWKVDICHYCTCLDGKVECHTTICPRLTCPERVLPADQCCPVCMPAPEATTANPIPSPLEALPLQEPQRGLRAANTLSLTSVAMCEAGGQLYENGEEFHTAEGCMTCTCLERQNTCFLQSCPPAPCARPSVSPDHCCPRCPNCELDLMSLPDGWEALAADSPCLHCACLDSMLRCEIERCAEAPCVSPHTLPGTCCPTCIGNTQDRETAGCVHLGKLHKDGKEWEVTNIPCLLCSCRKGQTTCVRLQCEVPCSHPLPSPGKCCASCQHCLFLGTMYNNGQNFRPEPCTHCSCQDGSVQCSAITCPPLSCSSPLIIPGQCCPFCQDPNQPEPPEPQALVAPRTSGTSAWHLALPFNHPEIAPSWMADEQPCMFREHEYMPGEHWIVDECTTCSCEGGSVHCRSQSCNVLTCERNKAPDLAPSTCCPVCRPRLATCLAFGSYHLLSFDGRMNNFFSACSYLLAEDCMSGTFSVQVKIGTGPREDVAETTEVALRLKSIAVQLLRNWVVMVDGKAVSLPYVHNSISVEQQMGVILLNTQLGIKMQWNSRGRLELSVPNSYWGRLCGLCGNFNGKPHDDQTLRTLEPAHSDAQFGTSWQVDRAPHGLSPTCVPAHDLQPCLRATYRVRSEATARCRMLYLPPFSRCHQLVPPAPFVAACESEVCTCGAVMRRQRGALRECICDTLEAYMSRCAASGLMVHWRSPSVCEISCPSERGYKFKECAPSCPRTCYTARAPPPCAKACVPGCRCPRGTLEHNDHCISPDLCPPIVHDIM
uniref:uncharacterized protein isoform X2 n=1 Tax=Myxine glutinosa TaxID=7769 RepID=UPI00358E89B8